MERNAIVTIPSILVLIVLASIFCGVLGFTGSEWANPLKAYTNAQKELLVIEKDRALMPDRIEAERELMRRQSEDDQKKRDLENRKAENELEHQRRMHLLQEADFQKRTEIKQKLLYWSGVGGILIAGAFLLSNLIIHTVRSLQTSAKPPQTYYKPTEEQKRWLIQKARERERQYRLQMIREREAQRLYQSGNGDHRGFPQPSSDRQRTESSANAENRDDLPLAV